MIQLVGQHNYIIIGESGGVGKRGMCPLPKHIGFNPMHWLHAFMKGFFFFFFLGGGGGGGGLTAQRSVMDENDTPTPLQKLISFS